ncbi:Cytoplasmic dynein 2 heavy chain 1 [Talaromyces islandicus]|uniref:Cytoplasmic dynein 2 heavy chain 1 n=1 Tax=Talaromyces islandicus TaxID=28573 RepID=A0A0U1LTK8_TALIS|nr:Cytoplasmic dynein 2 heavy chain 1 [Talaromyces islandicus]
MPSSTPEHEGFRHKLRQRFHRFRRQSEGRLKDTNISPPSISQYEESTSDSLPVRQASDVSRESTKPSNNGIGGKTKQDAAHSNGFEHKSTFNGLMPLADTDCGVASSNLWNAAYREAVESLGESIDIAILKGDNVAQLFHQLEEIDKDATQESTFLRGVKYLRSIQVPLEKFKLALDLASPLANIEPTATTVFGVVRSVTVIAISLASADLDFANQIGAMLEQISYIDDCDTLGQKSDKEDIHKALVLVYQKILEFYQVAFEILTKKGAKLMMTMILENNRLPNIVNEFLKLSENLRILVQKATWEIVEDIKAMLYDREIARWLGSDKMSRQNQYHAFLQDLRADSACQFLLTNANFINWYKAPGSQQLVILGDMGCGKTVAMTYLVDELSQRNVHQLPQPKICYYYCRNDETGQAINIFSALILSLLEQFPGLKKSFFEWYKQAQVSGMFDPAKNVKKLEEALQNILEAVDRTVFVIIDGLDECDRASRNNLLRFLKILMQKTPGLKVILSSRPQEEILKQLDKTAMIDLASDSQRDHIIVEKTVEKKLSHLSANVKELVIEKLSHLAKGSAIWAKMVIELIEVRGIMAFNPMQHFLEKMPLPGQLSELYTTLISRSCSNDPENQELARAALKLLATSHRPLSISELSWAVTLSIAEHITTVPALADLVDHQRVMSFIHPLIAHVNFNDLKRRQVRLVHQSVKEFVLEEWASIQLDLQGLSLTDNGRTISDQSAGSLEAFALNLCTRYLLLEDIGNEHLFSEEQVAIAELPQGFEFFADSTESVVYDRYCSWEAWEEDMIRYDPTERGFGEFFVYASCYWLEHFGAVTVQPFPNLESIENVCGAGSTRLLNWIEQNCRPDCAINPRFPFDGSLHDPLSITSLYGSESMLRYMLENSKFNKEKYSKNPAMGAADQILQWGDVSRLRILLLDPKIGHQLQNIEFFRLIIKNWVHPLPNRHQWDVVFDLVNDVSDKLVREKWGNELLCVAAGVGCMPIVQRLMANAQNQAQIRNELLREIPNNRYHSKFDNPPHQSIGEAVLGNHVDVVKFLLEETGIEAHLQYRNTRGENVFHLASRLCDPEMFHLLVPRFPQGVHQMDDQGDTALMRIIKNTSASKNRYESAKILLSQSDTDWGSYSSDEQQDPLRVAVKGADKYRKAKGPTIEAGDSGVFISCDIGRESKCIAEVMDIFTEYYQKSQEEAGLTNAPGSDDDAADDDIEAQIKREIEGLKPGAPTSRPFQAIKLDTACLSFIRVDKSIDPVKLVHDICTEANANPEQKKGRWLKRMTPSTQIKKVLSLDLDELSRDVLRPHFHSGGGPKKFAIRPSIRNNGNLNRDTIIKTVAAAVGPEHKVDLQNYDHMILVDVIQNIIGMSVVGSDYDKLKRFNLAEIYSPVSTSDAQTKPESES